MKNSISEDYPEVVVLIWVAFIIGAIATPPIFGVDAVGTTKVLEASGYKDIKITGYKWFNGTNDFYNTGFEATAPNGSKMSGNVSRGILFKGSTIRLD